MAGVGIEHEALLESAHKYTCHSIISFQIINYVVLHRHFVEKKPIWVQDDSLALKGPKDVDRSLAQYTGGLVKVGILTNQFKLILIIFYFD